MSDDHEMPQNAQLVEVAEKEAEATSESSQPPSHNTKDAAAHSDSARQQVSNSPEPPYSPPPDGGLRAWTQAAMAHIVLCSTWGLIQSYGVFETYYTTTLGISPSSIAWIGSIQIFLMFSISFVTGRALDAGYFRITFTSGIIMQLIGMFTTAQCTKYWQLLLAQGVCTGLGNGLQFLPVVGVLSTYFKRRKTTALAIASAGRCP